MNTGALLLRVPEVLLSSTVEMSASFASCTVEEDEKDKKEEKDEDEENEENEEREEGEEDEEDEERDGKGAEKRKGEVMYRWAARAENGGASSVRTINATVTSTLLSLLTYAPSFHTILHVRPHHTTCSTLRNHSPPSHGSRRVRVVMVCLCPTFSK